MQATGFASVLNLTVVFKIITEQQNLIKEGIQALEKKLNASTGDIFKFFPLKSHNVFKLLSLNSPKENLNILATAQGFLSAVPITLLLNYFFLSLFYKC